ncbi:protein kinase family protein [Pseudarthrobacter phenanthrenivorans Sphe3]|uniref:non-specific serine/threonine protein kinase n=1 Tax=Pseudarthrobacter phenanthrenivorans (strain DSM 18606 / JCM 16027 / LMG 23796 / Sphe3) TaxID=930171 RepID=F0M4S1_PSEPM|nr:serine/threonine-protein kinase [Pseudarthrobacter phenanthrenivorans]ADX72317.1 protein kinase family protein [Pseudarthrobacter phenanthrenivorans Sphe3]
MVAESPSSIKNEVVGGRYRLGEVIGRGGMSSVYCARDEKLGRDVALKLFAPQAPDADELKRQEAEIQLLATLNHPGLVTLFDAGIDTRIPDEPRPFLTMELVEGQDLRTRIRHSRVPLEELSVIGAGVADALAYVHGLGIIHRDIKPANILLVQIRPGEPLRPKLTDFGIARIADSTRLTATGTMVGTAAYLSPEQALGKPLSPASDIYSFGLVLLECIKGTVEYPGGAVESAVARLHRAPEIPEDLPSEWADLIRSMTAIEPLERPTAADIETALRQALVSPASTPGEVVPETTRVLPAMPFHPPSITAEESVDEIREAAGPGAPPVQGQVPDSTTVALAQERAKDLKPRTKRFWLAAILGLVVVLAAVAAVFLTLSAQSTPDVVPYPTVTGVLGEHLEELQKSVQP